MKTNHSNPNETGVKSLSTSEPQLPRKDVARCNFCERTAVYESVQTFEPGPYSILYFVGGDDIGLIKANPKRKREVEFYCEEHVPALEPKRILWTDGCRFCSHR